jgi:hypothetical protein
MFGARCQNVSILPTRSSRRAKQKNAPVKPTMSNDVRRIGINPSQSRLAVPQIFHESKEANCSYQCDGTKNAGRWNRRWKESCDRRRRGQCQDRSSKNNNTHGITFRINYNLNTNIIFRSLDLSMSIRLDVDELTSSTVHCAEAQQLA